MLCGLLILVVGLLAGCSSSSSINSVIKGFFSEVNKSNFETAKVQYLSTVLINTVNTPGGPPHKTIQASFEKVIGQLESVEVQGLEIKGESATATACLLGFCGSRCHCKIELVKEAGREWRISEWGEPEFVGQRGWELLEKNPKAAMDEFVAALAGNPRDAWLVFGLGMCYLKAGDSSAAEKKFSEALHICPDICFDEYSELAAGYQVEGNLSAAEASLRKALDCNLPSGKPEKARQIRAFTYYRLAEVYLGRSKFDEAMDSAQKALALFSSDNLFIGPALDIVGWAYYKKGDRGQALNYLKRAVEKAPTSPHIQQHYAEASR
jgi:tetratricopeptide (TPR) repeat protein